ncbi:MAG: phosphate acyltransferase PlsX [Candidatus Omnitrophica bacterium]|nr:phosphate acyltransferase PlsX [Candidatus Omnitrophota bacterium]
MKYRIGLDISGGDFAPEQIFKGALLAKQEFHDDLILIGVKEEIEEQIHKHNLNLNDFTIIDAPEKIGMGESPASSVRKKKNSSISIGMNLLREKKIDAFVSCGNTGAAVCGATLQVGLMEGVERPGIALVIPTKKGISMIVDVGANIDPKPIHLFQYGIMASVYSHLALGKENPSIGLLNIGEEESKGPDYVRNVHKLFSEAGVNFIGNLEAKDIFSGKCDCIVCDGFVGNVALKVSEGVAETMGKFLLDEIKKGFIGKIGLLLIMNSLKRVKRLMDYAEYGGALLLGVDGIVIIGHGRSNAIAVKNAVKVAIHELKCNVNSEIKSNISKISQDPKIKEMLNDLSA